MWFYWYVTYRMNEQMWFNEVKRIYKYIYNELENENIKFIV